MRRYSELLRLAYGAGDHYVRYLAPTDVLSRRFQGGVRKWAAYVEQYLIFPFRLIFLGAANRVHLADHSDSIYLWFIPRRAGLRVVTCHDLLAVKAAAGLIPEASIRWTGRLYQSLILRSIRRADKILAVSKTTGEDVREFVGRDVKVVPNPLSADWLTMSASGIVAPEHRQDYALVVSTVGWRKRRDLAVAAWVRLRGAGFSIGLVIVGPALTTAEREIAGGLVGDISVRSSVPDIELFSLYSKAMFLLQVSKYEGFCWPIIEANAAGTVAVCSDEPVLRDTGAGNIFMSTGDLLETDMSHFRAAVAEAVSPQSRSRVRERALKFSFEVFAKDLLEQDQQ